MTASGDYVKHLQLLSISQVCIFILSPTYVTLIICLTNSLHKNAGSTVHLHSVALNLEYKNECMKLVVCCTLWHVHILYAMVCLIPTLCSIFSEPRADYHWWNAEKWGLSWLKQHIFVIFRYTSTKRICCIFYCLTVSWDLMPKSACIAEVSTKVTWWGAVTLC